jgi:hypothetical protein
MRFRIGILIPKLLPNFKLFCSFKSSVLIHSAKLFLYFFMISQKKLAEIHDSDTRLTMKQKDRDVWCVRHENYAITQ